jgi:alkane 1-monooxygenase
MTTMNGTSPARARAASPYLLSLVLPLVTTAFFLVAEGRRWMGAGWLLTLLLIAVGDEVLPPLDPTAAPSKRSVAALAPVVAVVQVANVSLFVWTIGRSKGSPLDVALAVALMGIGGAFSSLIAAHELVHGKRWRWLGRLVLATALYDHFFTDHLRGHHRTAGTPADVLTARRDETFWAYAARSWRGEIARAWRIERERNAHRFWLRAFAANDVIRGIAIEVAILVVAFVVGGPSMAALVVAQAAVTHLLVAAINFVEHWGIVRTTPKGGPVAWDTRAPLSHYALLGLSFHADHHAHAARAFDRLVVHEESPKLPYGYFRLAGMVLTQSASVRRVLAAALEVRPATCAARRDISS